MNPDDLKCQAAYHAVDRFVVTGMRLGLGTGSTSRHALVRIAEGLRAGKYKDLRGVPTSKQTEALARELGDAITKVQGTGLLVSCELNERLFKCYGADSIEEYLRCKGIGVIHGGKHSLRFTPPFAITSAEISVIIDAVRDALQNGPRKA